jgi:hypothetical protein
MLTEMRYFFICVLIIYFIVNRDILLNPLPADDYSKIDTEVAIELEGMFDFVFFYTIYFFFSGSFKNLVYQKQF